MGARMSLPYCHSANLFELAESTHAMTCQLSPFGTWQRIFKESWKNGGVAE